MPQYPTFSFLFIIAFFFFSFFFFNDTATTEIYTLSLHDALPIFGRCRPIPDARPAGRRPSGLRTAGRRDRKSTRLNSSHDQISYAVFCLKKKKNNNIVMEKKLTHRLRRDDRTTGTGDLNTRSSAR